MGKPLNTGVGKEFLSEKDAGVCIICGHRHTMGACPKCVGGFCPGGTVEGM